MEWKYGQKAALARAAGISRQHLNHILGGKKCSRELARRLEKASLEIGMFIPRYDWMETDVTQNPLIRRG